MGTVNIGIGHYHQVVFGAAKCLHTLTVQYTLLLNVTRDRRRTDEPDGLDVGIVEQPCRDAADLRALRRLIDIPVAADESIRLAADPGSVRLRDTADVAVLKAAPLGGVAATLAIAKTVMGADDATTLSVYDEMMPMFNIDGHFKPKALAVLSKSFVDMKTLDKEPDMTALINESFLPKK